MNVPNSDAKSVVTLKPGRIIRAGTIVRAYAPSGYYWREGLSLATAVYANKEGLIFTACHFDEDQHAGEFYTEFDDPMIEEIRLLAALILPIGLDYGMVSPYPLGYAHRIKTRDDLRSFEILKETIEHMRSIFLGERFRPWVDGPYPPLFGGPNYEFRDAPSPVDLQKRIFDAIDPKDGLLMRGLATLVKSTMLARHAQFFEAAIYTLYISLDASFNLVVRELRTQGIDSPSAHEAGAFIEKAFDEETSGTKYFEEYYEDRIKVMHPESRFGIFPYAPVMHDDFYWLYTGYIKDYVRFIAS